MLDRIEAHGIATQAKKYHLEQFSMSSLSLSLALCSFLCTTVVHRTVANVHFLRLTGINWFQHIHFLHRRRVCIRIDDIFPKKNHCTSHIRELNYGLDIQELICASVHIPVGFFAWELSCHSKRLNSIWPNEWLRILQSHNPCVPMSTINDICSGSSGRVSSTYASPSSICVHQIKTQAYHGWGAGISVAAAKNTIFIFR